MPIKVTPPFEGRGAVSQRVVAATETAVTVTLTDPKRYLRIENIGTGVAYIGGSTVVTTSTFSQFLTPRQGYDFGHVNAGFNLGVICVSGGATVIGVREDA